MPGKVETWDDILQPDALATAVADTWCDNDTRRNVWKNNVEEIRRYVYATDTTQTTNSQLPWKNKTTIPKLCQIRDNLYANYTATMFPQQKWLEWLANEKLPDSVAKRDAIVNYMQWAISQPQFKHELDKIILDYIDFGNCFATVDWVDDRVQTENGTQAGYIGPVPKRISPLDITFTPTAEDFGSAPKIIRSVISMGELKELLNRMSSDDNREEYEALFKYLKNIRNATTYFEGDWTQQNALYAMDGFTSFVDYLRSDTVEVLTFYGDLYDSENDEFLKNHVITVVDRHKLIGKRPNASYFGKPPIFHAPWRKRQDNLWGMGPLDNLVGMQYRLDHIENMRADIVDLSTYPVQLITGYVDDYIWAPGAKIFANDEGKVELVQPDVNVLQANFDLQRYEQTMEQMAGAPREAMGFRTPGEKTKYEVQSLENAAARIFQNKIKQFEEQVVEPLLNAMLELARRKLVGTTVIQVFDNELNAVSFQELTAQDITGVGRIKPIAARHFAEQSQIVQNLTSLSQSQLWPAVMPHFSGVQMAKLFENFFNIKDYNIVLPYVAISEQAEAQKEAQALQENVMTQGSTATGIGEDYDMEHLQALNTPQAAPPNPQEAQ
jgi:hypothetical protein